MILKAELRRKELFVNRECIVERIVEVSGNEFDALIKNNVNDYDFINKNRDVMYYDYESEQYHCLLIIGTDRLDGVLVESEGSNYAIYSSYISNARDIIENQTMPSAIKSMINRVKELYDFVEKKIYEKAESMNMELDEDRRITISDEEIIEVFEIRLDYDISVVDTVCLMLEEKELVSGIDYDEFGFKMEISPKLIELLNKQEHSMPDYTL